ncbi:MAG: DNA-3-methyladenine glycosylase 2 family protein [Acidimicrobiia bacterium]|nr:DNA-3-methyladenine glycosylase 2 family protein [Acidimicrobiia bacterium]
MTPADYAKAGRLLRRRDPVIGDLIRRHGACGLAITRRGEPFQALVRAIVSQQLSVKAAATILGRFEALFVPDLPSDGAAARRSGRRPFPRPAEVSAMAADRLRGAGLSRMKVAFLHDLSARVVDGSLNLRALRAMPDDAVIDTLTAVKGVGRWTAEMFLMFQLQRPDVLPLGDLGIARAIRQAYRLRTRPTPERMTRLAEPWRPYRSVACWYLWASLDNLPPAA